MKKVQINFKEEAFEEYSKLKKFVKGKKKTKKQPSYFQLLKSIERTLGLIEENPFHGDLIPRKFINKNILKEYGTDKIYREELIGYWRLLYTLSGDDIRVLAIILDFMNHDKYNKLFGYKKK